MLENIRRQVFFETLKEGKNIEISVRGECMYPYIKSYDILTIVPNQDVHCGDIIMVKNKSDRDGYFIHRLVRIKKSLGQPAFYTRGDNLGRGLEGPFLKEQICGRVLAIRRKDITIKINVMLHTIFGRLAVFLSPRLPVFLKITSRFFCMLFMHHPLNVRFLGDPLHQNTQDLLMLVAQDVNANMEKQKKAVDLIKEGVRWNYFGDLVLSNGIVMQALECIYSLKENVLIPDFIFERLNNARLKTIAETSRNHKQLFEILVEFQNSGIAVIPLKGTILAFFLYQDITRRGLSLDIDLLIKEEGRDKACLLFKKLGYYLQSDSEIKPLQWDLHLQKDGCFPVDLQWDISMMFRSRERVQGLWKAARFTGTFEDGLDARYYAWDNITLLLFLCANLVNSGSFRNFKSFLDIKKLVENTKALDWDSFVAYAYRYRINNSAYLGLVKVKEFFDADIPKRIIHKLRPGLIKRIFIDLFFSKEVIFEVSMRKKILHYFLSYFLFEFMEAHSFVDYLKIVKRVILPSREYSYPTYATTQNKERRVTNWQYARYIITRLLRGFYKTAREFI